MPIHTRPYEADAVRQLLEHTGGWATSWDDVLNYLEGADAQELSRKSNPQLFDDVQHLRNDNVHFTADYRTVWKQITGEEAAELPPPPAALLDGAQRDRSSRVLDILQRVESKEYKEMARMLHSGGDAGWNPK